MLHVVKCSVSVACCSVVWCGVRELLLQLCLQFYETCFDDRWQHGGGSKVGLHLETL